ncbi:hypothetical protein [Pedobacter sp.]|uniref:hypothetical protein n=1 Tax=Pedobacter sp. TaxID=1411316 RepID=UPI00396CAA54
MKNFSWIALVLIFCTTLQSCEFIAGIFKAGVWSGVLIVVLVLALIIWLAAKIFGGSKDS